MTAAPLTEERVFAWLSQHPAALEQFVISSSVSTSTFRRWIERRRSAGKDDAAPPRTPARIRGSWTASDVSAKRVTLCEQGEHTAEMMWELGACCAALTGVQNWEANVQSEEDVGVTLQLTRPANRVVAAKKKVIDGSDRLLGEIVFYEPIGGRDKLVVQALSAWAAGLIHYAQLAIHLQSNGEQFESFTRQRKLASFLLDVAKSIFQDIVSMDTVLLKTMNFAQKLVNADRASLFLVDSKAKQLYARIFDVGTGDNEDVRLNADGQREIRFSMGCGLAGYVASTGHTLNIEDAYEDERFNQAVDKQTGYRTRSMLCMPIYTRGHIIGVVQMVNKLATDKDGDTSGVFTKDDEQAFEIFAVYCGLALHHAKLYDKIRRSEQKHRVALEVLAYHSVCHRDEVNTLRQIEIPERVPQLETFDFNGNRLSELEKPLYAVYMFETLFRGKFAYDRDELLRFVLTVRKNYRQVAYHNWAHGWAVAHAMFVMLIKTEGQWSTLEALALYVACICHDLDHRGKNNTFMREQSTPLASIYSTSVMEHHHFNQTVTILQQDGHNILRGLTGDDYKTVLGLIKHCILATDLMLFFKYRVELETYLATDFDIHQPDQRALVQALMMTGCDLIASAKPWQIQTETVKVIFEEFYDQGDVEKRHGRQSIPMMDRSQAHLLPQMQVGFLRNICIPCYDTLSKVTPAAETLKGRCETNATKWEELDAEQKALLNRANVQNDEHSHNN